MLTGLGRRFFGDGGLAEATTAFDTRLGWENARLWILRHLEGLKEFEFVAANLPLLSECVRVVQNGRPISCEHGASPKGSHKTDTVTKVVDRRMLNLDGHEGLPRLDDDRLLVEVNQEGLLEVANLLPGDLVASDCGRQLRVGDAVEVVELTLARHFEHIVADTKGGTRDVRKLANVFGTDVNVHTQAVPETVRVQEDHITGSVVAELVSGPGAEMRVAADTVGRRRRRWIVEVAADLGIGRDGPDALLSGVALSRTRVEALLVVVGGCCRTTGGADGKARRVRNIGSIRTDATSTVFEDERSRVTRRDQDTVGGTICNVLNLARCSNECQRVGNARLCFVGSVATEDTQMRDGLWPRIVDVTAIGAKINVDAHTNLTWLRILGADVEIRWRDGDGEAGSLVVARGELVTVPRRRGAHGYGHQKQGNEKFHLEGTRCER